jgi:hypothetical protein
LNSILLTVFDGFRNMTTNNVQLRTIVGGAVAMECDFLDGSPRPQISWFRDNVNTPIAMSATVMILEGGRYLFISALSAEERASFYRCTATNTLLATSQASRTTYTLDGDLEVNSVETYLPERPVTATLGVDEIVVYAASSRISTGRGIISVLCDTSAMMVGVSVTVTGLVLTFSGLAGVESNRQVNITCPVLVQFRTTKSLQVTFFFTVTGK